MGLLAPGEEPAVTAHDGDGRFVFVCEHASNRLPKSLGMLGLSPADPDKARWNGQSLSSGGLAQVYGFTDLDGSRPDCWRYMIEVQEAGKPADTTGYR